MPNPVAEFEAVQRLEAARLLKRKDIQAEIRTGDYEQALRFACRANETHGVRVGPEDRKRRILEAAKWYVETKGKAPSNVVLADLCSVSESYVRKHEAELRTVRSSDAPRVGKDNKERKPPDPDKPKKGKPKAAKPDSPRRLEDRLRQWRSSDAPRR